jgi:hypothetical protein
MDRSAPLISTSPGRHQSLSCTLPLLIFRFLRGFLLIFGCLLISAIWSEHAWAQVGGDRDDYQNWKNPFFDGVKQVYLYVHYVSDLPREEQKALPPSLHRENIEGVLMQLYRQRFSSEQCRPLLQGKNPYGCDNQPIILLTDSDYRTTKSNQDRERPGSLSILLQVMVERSVKGGVELNPRLVAIYLAQTRPELPFDAHSSFPVAIPTNLKDETIHDWLYDYIKHRIH